MLSFWPPPPAWRIPLALLAITALGLAVRLVGLTGYAFWEDEAYHVALVQEPTVGAMLDAVLANPPSDPLYVLLLRAWVAVGGTGEASVRLLSVLCSTATLPVTYALGRGLAGRGAGLGGAALLALSPYALELGQEAALYALAALTTTAALAAGWYWRATGRNGALYVGLGIVAIYSHYVVAAILAGVALAALPAMAGPRRLGPHPWLAAHALIALAWTPWLLALAVYWRNSATPRATLAHAATMGEILGALVQFSSGTAVLQQGRIVPAALGLVVGAGLLGAGGLAGRAADKRGLRVLAVVAGAIFLAPAALSALTGRWLFVPHFMLFLLPALCVLLAAGVTDGLVPVLHFREQLAKTLPRIRTFGVAALLLAWLGVQMWGLALYWRYPPHGAGGLRELAAQLQAGGSEPVWVTPPALMLTLRPYYAGPLHGLPSDFDLRAIYLPYEAQAWNAQSLAVLLAANPAHGWLVYRPELDAGGAFLQAVQERYRLVQQAVYPYATLYRFERP